MPELTQNENGKWKLKGIHHDIPGVTIQAHYTYPYYHGQTVNFEITSQQGEDVDTPWETELGTPIISTVTADEIKKKYDECIIGNTRYVVKDHEFQVVPYNVVFEVTTNTPVVESIVTSEIFAVRSEGVSDIGYDESESVNVISANCQTHYVDVEFGQNLSDEDRTIKITLSGKTASGKVIKASSTITQKKSDPEPTIWINPDKWVVPYVGTEEERTAHVYITVGNGRFSGYTLSDQNIATASLEMRSDSEAILTLVFNAAVGTVGNRTLHATGCGINGLKTDCVEIEIAQTKNWSLSDVDYVLFTYEWSGDDGHDLDSFTFIDGLATSSTGDYGYTFEKGVGYGNGSKKDIPGEAYKKEYYLGNDYNKTLLKMACDNMESGGEYTLIDLKRLNECIEDAISKGEIPPDRNVITVYLMGNWYAVRKQGTCSVSFTAYKGERCTVEHVLIDEQKGIYSYEITGWEEKETKKVENIEVYAGNGVGLTNYQKALTNYTTIAAFEYFLKENRFELITGEDLKYVDGGKRYQSGVRVKSEGDIVVSGSTASTMNFSFFPKIEIKLSNINSERTYLFTLEDCQYTYYTGDTPYSQDMKILPGSCTTDTDPEKFDPQITLEQVSDTSFKVTVPAGHIYSGTNSDGYLVNYKFKYDQSKLGYEILENYKPYIYVNEVLNENSNN